MSDFDHLYPSMAEPAIEATGAADPSLLTTPAVPPPPEGTPEALYPSMKAEAPAQEAPPTDQQQRKTALTGGELEAPEAKAPRSNVPDDIRELRESEPGRNMFSPQKTYEYDVPDDLLDGTEDSPSEIPAELRAAAVVELREMTADLGLSGAEIRGFIAQVRAVAPTQPQTVEEVQAQAARALSQLNRELGNEQAAQKTLADAKQILARDPRVRQIVVGAGLGNDVKTIRTLAELARRERANGRLR